MLKGVLPHHMVEVMATAVSIAVWLRDRKWNFPLILTTAALKKVDPISSFFSEFQFFFPFSRKTTGVFETSGTNMTIQDEIASSVGDSKSDPGSKKWGKMSGPGTPYKNTTFLGEDDGGTSFAVCFPFPVGFHSSPPFRLAENQVALST